MEHFEQNWVCVVASLLHSLYPCLCTHTHTHTHTPWPSRSVGPPCGCWECSMNPDLKSQSPLSRILTHPHRPTQPGARGLGEPQGQVLEVSREGEVAGRPPASTGGPERPRLEQGDLQLTQAPPCWPAHLSLVSPAGPKSSCNPAISPVGPGLRGSPTQGAWGICS